MFDQYLCKHAGLEDINFFKVLIRSFLLKFCLTSLTRSAFTSNTKSSISDDDLQIR